MRRRSWSPLPQGFLPSRNSGENLDRFIPNRSASNFEFLFIDRSNRNENRPVISESRDAYQKQLAEIFGMNRTRIFSFKYKAPDPYLAELIPRHLTTPWPAEPTRRRRYIPRTPERTLGAPDLVEDDCLSLLDWGSSNRLSIALGDTVYIWNASDSSISELVTIDHENGPVTSVSWAPDGRHIAVGLNNSEVQLWGDDTLLTTLRGGHTSRVASVAWKNHNILTTGGMDGQILNYDVRDPSRIVQTYRGHTLEVCGLKWSASGKQLASGGKDNVLQVWDVSMASSLHRLKDHRGTVKALAWCPFQRDLLASGGGDRNIKFWDTRTGVCLDSIDTGSNVSALLWSKHERELLSSHGFTRNQLTLWKYPAMVTIAELTGHESRVLFMAQSPDGHTVASAGGDEKLMFWNVFGVPEVGKPAPKSNPEPFACWNRIR